MRISSGALSLGPPAKKNESWMTVTGPFWFIDERADPKESYEQYRWLANDLGRVDRFKTLRIIAMSHCQMYSSGVTPYQKITRAIIDNNTYYTNSRVSMTHIINGMVGNIESHQETRSDQAALDITSVIDIANY
jgi:hypothetical protein